MKLQLTLLNSEVIDVDLPKTSIVIGRSNSCDVVVNHEAMSRRHCLIEFVNGEWFITDLDSINGVLVENERIPPNTRLSVPTFFNLSFGYVSNCQLISQTGGTHLITLETMMTPVEEPVKKSKRVSIAPPPRRQITKGHTNYRFINILALAVVIAAVVYFLQTKKNAPEPVPVDPDAQKVIDQTDTF